MSRPVWAAGLLLLALALPVQAADVSKPMPLPRPVPAPASSDLTIAEATAIQVARSLFPAAYVQGEPKVELIPSYSGHAAWNISWEGSVMIHVTVDGRDGQVLMAERWQMEPTLPSPERMTKAEAEVKAAQWLAKLAPGALGALQRTTSPIPEPDYDLTAFSFGFDWQAMGYPVPGAGAHLRIDGVTGELLSWYLNRPEGRMMLPPAILAESEARAAFSKLPLTLTYAPAGGEMIYYKEGPIDPQSMVLAYRPPVEARLSQSGHWVGPDGKPIPDVTIPTWKQVPPPIMPYKPPVEPLTKAEAQAIAQAAIGEAREPDLVNLYRWDGQLRYEFTWVDWTESMSGDKRVTVDARAGLVTDLYGGSDWVESKPSLSPAEALQAAVTFIQTFRPDLAGALYYPAPRYLGEGSHYSFAFERQHEGIMIQGYGVQVTMDGLTGRVASFWGNTTQPELILPEPKGVLPPGPLMAKLVEVAGLELGWVQMRAADEEPFYQLVWTLGQRVPVSLIEAQTGTFRDSDWTDVLRFRLPPTDVAGHWAEREIQALFERRIITVEDGQFHPEQAMTQAEAASWLARLDYGRPMPLIEEPMLATDAVAPGEPNPATPITREAFVRHVVVALGYEKIAGMANPIWMPFHDQAAIESGARNAVAVLNGLGVIQGTPEGLFLPKKSLTRAEAARILYQSLEHRRFGIYK